MGEAGYTHVVHGEGVVAMRSGGGVAMRCGEEMRVCCSYFIPGIIKTRAGSFSVEGVVVVTFPLASPPTF